MELQENVLELMDRSQISLASNGRLILLLKL